MDGVGYRVVCCGFSPCIQRLIEFAYLEKGAVNRALRTSVGVGGKGANTARMVRQLGGTPLLLGFAGGVNGRQLESMLSREGIVFRHVETSGETRICQTLLEQGAPSPTELVEEMPPLSAGEWEAMVALAASVEMADTWVAISGKLPAGAPVDAYARLVDLAMRQGGRTIVDAPGAPLLRALPFHPDVVKINEGELLQATGGTDIHHAAEEVLERGARAVLVTRGGWGALFVDGRHRLEIAPPAIVAVNPVGSGDAVTAGLAVKLSGGAEMNEALAFGMACGAANALQRVSGSLSPADVERLVGEVRIRKL